MWPPGQYYFFKMNYQSTWYLAIPVHGKQWVCLIDLGGWCGARLALCPWIRLVFGMGESLAICPCPLPTRIRAIWDNSLIRRQHPIMALHITWLCYTCHSRLQWNVPPTHIYKILIKTHWLSLTEMHPHCVTCLLTKWILWHTDKILSS